MSIDEKLVRHIADLAALELTEEEVNKFKNQLGRILEYIEKLQELELTNVEPFEHNIPREKKFREDKVIPSETMEACLDNAPEAKDSYFKVPKVIGGES